MIRQGQQQPGRDQYRQVGANVVKGPKSNDGQTERKDAAAQQSGSPGGAIDLPEGKSLFEMSAQVAERLGQFCRRRSVGVLGGHDWRELEQRVFAETFSDQQFTDLTVFFQNEFVQIKAEFCNQAGGVMSANVERHDDVVGSLFVETQGFVYLVGQYDDDGF